jgi:mercuric reductase
MEAKMDKLLIGELAKRAKVNKETLRYYERKGLIPEPQVCGVGLDEKQATQKSIAHDISIFPLEQVPRSIAAYDTRGFIKLIRDKKTHKLIGARIIAPEGSELLMELNMAVKFGITTEELSSYFHPYLTLSEGIKLAATTFDKNIDNLSCCVS